MLIIFSFSSSHILKAWVWYLFLWLQQSIGSLNDVELMQRKGHMLVVLSLRILAHLKYDVQLLLDKWDVAAIIYLFNAKVNLNIQTSNLKKKINSKWYLHMFFSAAWLLMVIYYDMIVGKKLVQTSVIDVFTT